MFFTVTLLFPDTSKPQLYIRTATNIFVRGTVPFAILLSLFLLSSSSVLGSMLLFLFCSIFLSLSLLASRLLLSMLSLLVYLGALIVLFAYIWMFITFSHRSGIFPLISLSCILFFAMSFPFSPASLFWYLLPSSFLLFLVCALFWAILVVVLVLDLSLGGFSS